MIVEEEKLHFSYDCHLTETEDERLANEKLQELKKTLCTPLYNVVLHDFFANQKKVESSKLYKVLDSMPKGGLHHIHTSAAPHVDTYIQLTYEDVTHYNEREGLFKVFTEGTHHEDGYVPCNQMRSFYADAKEYDNHLKTHILQTRDETAGMESHEIWQFF